MKARNLILLAGFLFIKLVVFSQCVFGDCENGFSIRKYEDSSVFEGVFKSGKKSCGVNYYKSGAIYKGNFEENKKHGEGLYLYKNQDTFQGIYKQDNKFFGLYKYKNGNVYEGYFKNEKPEGHGTLTSANGVKIDCIWKNGEIYSKQNLQLQTDSSLLDANIKASESVETTKSVIKPRMFAVVVGISRYLNNNNLKYADDDAVLIYDNLKAAFSKELENGAITILTNEQATSASVVNAMGNAFSQANENDYIVFYFSGHGSNGSFCAYDGFINHTEVKNIFVNSKSKYKVCVADACFSGGISNTQIVNNHSNLHDERMCVLMSSKSTQYSMEFQNLNHGIFSYYFVKGMRGKGDLNRDNYVTIGELFVYVKTMVSYDTNNKQIPVIFGNDLNKIPLSRIR
jgi:hypothetical protein